ncbi:MAG TPA: hypothetical protein VKR78_00365 [Acidimicrobiales bacterium]|nr:hypothetical protein [Acidimicrobiales bacterium]
MRALGTAARTATTRTSTTGDRRPSIGSDGTSRPKWGDPPMSTARVAVEPVAEAVMVAVPALAVPHA